MPAQRNGFVGTSGDAEVTAVAAAGVNEGRLIAGLPDPHRHQPWSRVRLAGLFIGRPAGAQGTLLPHHRSVEYNGFNLNVREKWYVFDLAQGKEPF